MVTSPRRDIWGAGRVWQENTSLINKVKEEREENTKGKGRQHTSINYIALNHRKKKKAYKEKKSQHSEILFGQQTRVRCFKINFYYALSRDLPRKVLPFKKLSKKLPSTKLFERENVTRLYPDHNRCPHWNPLKT